jgi:hypothetical protein
MLAYNNAVYSTAFIENDDATDDASSVYILAAVSGATDDGCYIYANGSLTCSGVLTGVVPVDGNRSVKTYTLQAAENWFEDAGGAQLQGGVAHVAFDATVKQIVNAAADYRVFLTPNGDSKGLYVANKTAEGFDVREQGGGTSSIAFDYRIMAVRKARAVDGDQSRLADVTDFKKLHPASAVRKTGAAPAVQHNALPHAPAVRRPVTQPGN